MFLSEFIYFIFYFFIRAKFPDDNFWTARADRSEIFRPVMGHGQRKKCIIFRPSVTPRWGMAHTQTPPNLPPPPLPIFLFAFQDLRNIFQTKNL